MIFLWFWGRPGRSMGWAHMQSARACAVETHSFVFACFLKNRLHMTSFWLNFGTVFCQQSQFWVKKEFQKMIQKKVTPLTQTSPYDLGPALPGSPPRVLQGFLNKKQLSEQETTTAAPVIWHALGQGPANFQYGPILGPPIWGPIKGFTTWPRIPRNS